MSSEALVRYNAERCEAALGPVCRCSCGGEFHGREHSEKWIRSATEQLDAKASDARKARDRQLDIFGDGVRA